MYAQQVSKDDRTEPVMRFTDAVPSWNSARSYKRPGRREELKVAMQEAQMAVESPAKLAEVYGQSEPALSEMTMDEAEDEMMW